MSRPSKPRALTLIVSGFVVVLVGLVGAGLGLIAIIDPVETKMADDLDPFGTPPSRIGSAAISLIFILVVVFGFWIISRADITTKN